MSRLSFQASRSLKIDQILHYESTAFITLSFIFLAASAVLWHREMLRTVVSHGAQRATQHFALSVDLYNHGQIEHAVTEAGYAIKLNPKYQDAHYNLGIFLTVLGKPAEAEKEFQEALLINPDLASAHLNLGILLAARGSAEAAEHCRKAAASGMVSVHCPTQSLLASPGH